MSKADHPEHEVSDVLLAIKDEIARISRGDNHGPTGIEMLSMAIEGAGGRPGDNSLSDAIIKSGDRIAESIENLANAISKLSKG